MSDIDPQQFGRLQAQVEVLIKTVESLDRKVDVLTAQLSEAKGGWRVLMLLGGASATVGSALTWLLTHLTTNRMP